MLLRLRVPTGLLRTPLGLARSAFSSITSRAPLLCIGNRVHLCDLFLPSLLSLQPLVSFSAVVVGGRRHHIWDGFLVLGKLRLNDIEITELCVDRLFRIPVPFRLAKEAVYSNQSLLTRHEVQIPSSGINLFKVGRKVTAAEAPTVLAAHLTKLHLVLHVMPTGRTNELRQRPIGKVVGRGNRPEVSRELPLKGLAARFSTAKPCFDLLPAVWREVSG